MLLIYHLWIKAFELGIKVNCILFISFIYLFSSVGCLKHSNFKNILKQEGTIFGKTFKGISLLGIFYI
jgi:hypothetical protein